MALMLIRPTRCCRDAGWRYAYPAYNMLPGCRMALRLSGLQYVAGMPDGANAYPAYKRFPYIAHGP
ncbi:TPA: hypothetical protein NBJ18_004390 [Citrobacter farmeri]|nr:hypothetical protein [Citrobacter farmeri]